MPTAIEMRFPIRINTIAGVEAPVGAATTGHLHQDPLYSLRYFLKTCKTGAECLPAALLHTMLAAAAARDKSKS